VLDLVLARHDGPVIVPMTVVEPAYFEETVGRLRGRGHEVAHFALLAERETVLRRLRERAVGRAVDVIAGSGTALRRESFAVSHLDRCLAGLAAPEFAVTGAAPGYRQPAAGTAAPRPGRHPAHPARLTPRRRRAGGWPAAAAVSGGGRESNPPTARRAVRRF
jgi:hypothetical protein